MDLKSAFGANVRNFRRSINITQEALAERVDVSIETIGKIERGVSAPSFETVERIAVALDINPLVLFGASGEAIPGGERGKALGRIQATLSNMNDEQLSRASKMLEAFVGGR
jgi:transcriptional regulator with XRE-family HTH domain